MENEGFLIDIGSMPDSEDSQEKEKVPVKNKGGKPKEAPKKDEKGKVDVPDDDGLLTVDTGPLPEEKRELEEKASGEKEEKEIEDKGETPEPKETESPAFLHATALQESGVLPHLKLEELKGKSDKEIIEAAIFGTQDEIETTVKSIVGQYEGEYQKFIELLNSGGDVDEYAKIKVSQKRFTGIDEDKLEDNVDLMKSLITEDMKNRDYDDSEVLATIKEIEDKEEEDDRKEAFLKRSKSALVRLKKRDDDRETKLLKSSQEAEEKQKKETEKTLKRVDKNLESLKEIIPGVPVPPREKEVIRRLMTVPAEYRDGVPVSRAQQIRMTDPVAYEMKHAYYIAIGLYDENPTWEKVIKRATSDASKKILERLKKTDAHKPGKPAAEKPMGKAEDEEVTMPDFEAFNV